MRPAGGGARIRTVRCSVLIVDDHAGFRARARALLTAAGYRVVGEAGLGRAGVEAARELTPDVVLLDVQLPDVTGFDVARELVATADPPLVVLISSREAADYGARIPASGAHGFICKDELSARSLADALQVGDL
jgi:DNA-binding NarL/FixJ family response regulator